MNNKILQEKEHSCKGAEWILEYNNFLDKVIIDLLEEKEE